MAYIDGAFAGRRSKRGALAVLALVCVASFARGMLRETPGPQDAAPAPDLPGVALAQPLADPPPAPALQAAEPKPVQLAAARPSRRARPAQPAEPTAMSVEAAVEPASAVVEPLASLAEAAEPATVISLPPSLSSRGRR